MKGEKEIQIALKVTAVLKNDLPKEVQLVLMGFLDALQWVVSDRCDVPVTLVTLTNFDSSVEKIIEELKNSQEN